MLLARKARRRVKRKNAKLSSIISTMDSDTNVIKEPINPLRESKITNFVEETALKFEEPHEKSLTSCKLYIPGTGAIGAPKCLLLQCSKTAYLFNCSEDIQKCGHMGIKLHRVRHIFLSNIAWENVGGFPGLAKMLYESNEKSISKFALKIHGPPGLVSLKAFTIDCDKY